MICIQCNNKITTKAEGYFCFVRHGQTEMNRRNLTIGSIDEPLNDTGRRQSREMAGRFKKSGKKFNLIITSSPSRAHETADIIGEELGLKVLVDERLKDRCVGIFEGKPEKPDSYKRFLRQDFIVPGGESFDNFEKRISSFLFEYQNKYLDKTTLFVTHALVILTIIKLMHDWNEEKIINYPIPGNGEAVCFMVSDKCRNCGSSFFISNSL